MPGISLGTMTPPKVSPTLNPEAFHTLVQSHGIRMVHARPIPCPCVRDLRGGDSTPSCSLCNQGFRFYQPVEFVGVMQQNTMGLRTQQYGALQVDTAAIIMPLRDINGGTMDVQVFDRITLPNHSVRYWQRVEHSQTGIDLLSFPAIKVEILVDREENVYKQGVDFNLDDAGRIVWTGQRRPKWDPIQEQGGIYSVSYYMRPVFTIIQIPHQIRSTQVQSQRGPGTTNDQQFHPQLVVVRKDFIPESKSYYSEETLSADFDRGSIRR